VNSPLSTKANTVLIIRNAYPWDFGGGERYPVNLAIELQKNDLTPIVATAHERIRSLATEATIQNISMPWSKFQNFGGWRIILTPLYIVRQIRLFFWYIATIKRYKVDALHLQSRDDFIAGTLAGKMLKIPVVWTDHADLKYIYKNIGTFYKNPIGKLVFKASKRATKIIIVSKNELSLINESLGQERLKNIAMVYNGVTDTPIKPIREYDAKTTVFALSSRLVSTKGIGEVIAASHKLDLNNHNHKVVLLGEGPEESAFKALAGMSVVFKGFPPNALSYVAGADIFVHPTYNEAFSLSLVEAAMLGMPVITTKVGGNPEIIIDKKTGLLVKPKDASDLYDAMLFAIKNADTMKKYGKNLRELYEKSFQFDEIVRDGIIPLYNEVV
jgi:glycosyltransferase involved in cell wall biosynthesis